MSIGTQARAEWRVLISAALIGSGVGLALGAGYMAGGMADAAADHARAARIATAASGAFSDTVLHRNAAGMDAGVIAVARNHDPRMASGPDRQAALLARGLDAKYADSLALQEKLAAAGARPRSGQDAMRELDCLTQAVYFEARGEIARGQAAVAQVVLNRVKHPAFPKTVCGVVFQGSNRRTGCQFSFACDGSMRGQREPSAWERSRKVAARALSGRLLGEVGTATHFHTTAVSPAWGPQMRRVAQVGMHVFYKFNPRGARPVPAAPAISGQVMLASHEGPAGELRLANAVVEKPGVDKGLVEKALVEKALVEKPGVGGHQAPALTASAGPKAIDVAPAASDASATTTTASED